MSDSVEQAALQRLIDFQERLTRNQGPDRSFGAWKMVDIHLIPTPVPMEAELDVWISEGKDMYLLRVCRLPGKRLFLEKSQGWEAPLYLVAEWESFDGTKSQFQEIIREFEAWGIPGPTKDAIRRQKAIRPN